LYINSFDILLVTTDGVSQRWRKERRRRLIGQHDYLTRNMWEREEMKSDHSSRLLTLNDIIKRRSNLTHEIKSNYPSPAAGGHSFK
jgi:hypothetical protein